MRIFNNDNHPDHTRVRSTVCSAQHRLHSFASSLSGSAPAGPMNLLERRHRPIWVTIRAPVCCAHMDSIQPLDCNQTCLRILCSRSPDQQTNNSAACPGTTPGNLAANSPAVKARQQTPCHSMLRQAGTPWIHLQDRSHHILGGAR